MDEFTFKLSHPITDEEWNLITDAELEHTDNIEFTTPSGKKVLFQKVKRGKWVPVYDTRGRHFICPFCGEWEYHNAQKFCGECGARMEGERKYDDD